MCVLSLCVCVKFVCVKFCMCKEAGGGGGEGARDTESKTRTPHKDMYVCMYGTRPQR